MASDMRGAVLNLYRECLRSARRIPTQEQRAVWLAYTREKFKENRLLEDPKRVRREFNEGQEQLDRMRYYLAAAEQKAAMEQEQQQEARHARHHHHHHQQQQQRHASASASAAAAVAWDVGAFLRASIPGVGPEDAARYEAALRGEGFGDDRRMLAYLKEEDLEGWKKAHRRAFLAAVRGMAVGGGGSG